MKKFLKIFSFLIVSLVVLASGFDAVLDHYSHYGKQNTLTVYSDNGTAVLAYTGNLDDCKALGKSSAVAMSPFHFLHRT